MPPLGGSSTADETMVGPEQKAELEAAHDLERKVRAQLQQRKKNLGGLRHTVEYVESQRQQLVDKKDKF
eukprot:SAG22_NODE_9171_length_605_cov_1.766798_1_plen_68_part_10